MTLPLSKAHAFGNDFLFVPRDEAASVSTDLASLAKALCDRHEGAGGDGLILFSMGPASATMRLLNADGSPSELSGNGLRCLAALVARSQQLAPGATITVDTDAGIKILDLLGVDGSRYTFRAALGQPERIQQQAIVVLDRTLTATTLWMGNPQCVILGPLPDLEFFHRFGPALATHAIFPAGTNVEFAQVDAPDRVRILIWERGVGPTLASGTGASASAVAAASHGGAGRSVDVIAPGGTQHVEWRDEGVYLTGWAEVVFEGTWVR